MEYLTAGDLCSRTILGVSPETPVRQTLQLLTQHQKSSLLVLLHGEAVGIVTERDVVRSFAKIMAFSDLAVRDIMSSPLLTIAASDDAFAVFHQMRTNRIRHFAVIDADYAPLGLLSLSDLLYKYAPHCIPAQVTVAELMARQVTTTTADQSIRQVLGEMAHRGVSCIVVLRDDKPIGMLSERDVPQLLLLPPQELDHPVATVMTPPHPTIEPATPALEAISTMRLRSIRRLVVAGNDGNLLGIVTQSLLGRAICC